MVPETGRRVGPYEILGRIGGGGMGHVFRAWDARLHREIAIKFLHDEYAMPGMRERFLREARAASALNHPNICTVFDIGEQDGDPYLVMELLQGQTLKDRLDHARMSVEDMLCVGKEVAEALEAAHAKGVIHRDIKPANIFLVPKPSGGTQAKVLDFGLAKIEGGVLGARGGRSVDITSIGATVGTLAYMSPEQARGEVLDSRSDLFSLGVVMYEMATRQIPFPGATSALVFVKLLNQAPEPVRDWNEAVPRDFEKVISKLMAKERTARFQTAHELYEALSKVNEKPAGGNWLRRATAAVPLVRAAEPARRLPPRRRELETDTPPPPGREALREPAREPVREPAREPVDRRPPASTPIPQRPSTDQPQFLRPVARVPRPDATPGPSSDVAALRTQSASAPAQAGAGSATALKTPVPPAELSLPEAAARPVVSPTAAEPLATDLSSGEFAAAIQQDEGSHAPRIRLRVQPLWIAGGVVLLIVLGVAAWLIVNRGHFSPGMLSAEDAVVVTEIENKTGDKSLDATVAEGLQLTLEQSPYLLLRRGMAYRLQRHLVVSQQDGEMNPQVLARTVAQRLGVKAYLYGQITGTTAPYVLHVDLLNATSGDTMTEVEEKVPSLQEVGTVIDRVGDDLRANVGEDGDSISHNHVTLSREATQNLDALHAFAQAEDAFANGDQLGALKLYQQAVTLDPRFVQAQLALSRYYARQRAEIAAADTAKLALSASDGTSDRLHSLAQFNYELNASGDYTRAAVFARHLISVNPHDSEALEGLAVVLRLQGHMVESLQAAQQSYTEDPDNVDALVAASNALVALDRYDAAYQLQGQWQRLGFVGAWVSLVPAFLEGKQGALSVAIASMQEPSQQYRTQWSYGLYLDNIGQLKNGLQLWTRNAGLAQDIKGLESVPAFLLAQGALNRALLGDCSTALSLVRQAGQAPGGMTALFNMGMAQAMCGEASTARQTIAQLQQRYPQSFNVNSFYVADIGAAIALNQNDPATALDLLKNARQFDLISLTPYLRGKAHVALRQGQIGIVDYQTILAHRGVTFIVGSDVYPVAEIGVARAFADTGDLGNSAGAYKHFLELWQNADPGQPLLTEARAHAQ